MAKTARTLKDLDELKPGETAIVKGFDVEVVKGKNKKISKTKGLASHS